MTLLCASEQLIGCLPEVKWAKQVMALATKLQEECLAFAVAQLALVTRTAAFHSLRRVSSAALGHPGPDHQVVPFREQSCKRGSDG